MCEAFNRLFLLVSAPKIRRILVLSIIGLFRRRYLSKLINGIFYLYMHFVNFGYFMKFLKIELCSLRLHTAKIFMYASNLSHKLLVACGGIAMQGFDPFAAISGAMGSYDFFRHCW